MPANGNVHAHTLTRTYTHTHMHTHTNTHIHTRMSHGDHCVFTFVPTDAHTHTNTLICAYHCWHMYVCPSHTHTHTLTHLHIHIHTHTHAHSLTHTHAQNACRDFTDSVAALGVWDLARCARDPSGSRVLEAFLDGSAPAKVGAREVGR